MGRRPLSVPQNLVHAHKSQTPLVVGQIPATLNSGGQKPDPGESPILTAARSSLPVQHHLHILTEAGKHPKAPGSWNWNHPHQEGATPVAPDDAGLFDTKVILPATG